MRNGFGNPPLCRVHALELTLEGDELEIDQQSPIHQFLDLADRLLSRNQDVIVKEVRTRFGSYLAGRANEKNAKRISQEPRPPRNPRARPRPAPSPRRPSPPPPRDDPRVVLGIPPSAPLTKELIKEKKRQLAKIYHPDAQGNPEAMRRVNKAADELLAMLP